MPTRYIVHGTDPASKTPSQKVFEAESAGEAERQAQKLGLTVLAVEVDMSSLPAEARPAIPVSPGDHGVFRAPARAMEAESTMWSGSESQWVNGGWFGATIGVAILSLGLSFFTAGQSLWGLTVVPLLVLICGWKLLVVRSRRYTLTSQRLRMEEGVFSKRIDEIELYRLKDTELKQSFVDRILGIGTIEVISSDPMNPTLTMRGIPGAAGLREQLRQATERVRLARGVRELDVS